MSERKQQNEKGPIAETYEELQGIPKLRLAFDKNKPEKKTEIYTRTLLQGVELIFLNLNQICERQIAEKNKGAISSRPKCANHVTWHAALLKIAVALANEALVKVKEADSIFSPPPYSCGRKTYLASFEQLAKIELENIKDEKRRYSTAIVAKTTEGSLTTIIQKTGEAIHLCSILSARLDEIYSKVNVNDANMFLAYDCLEPAFSFPMLNSKLDTYYTQFRLLHQIPELITFYCLDEISYLKKSSSLTAIAFAISLIEIRALLTILPNCLTPLISLMVPREYYKIRENLGATSGSHSKNLSPHGLRSEIEIIKNIVLTRFAADPALLLINTVLSEIDCTILLWLDFHLMLPRALLGGNGTVSLMGNPDGLTAATRMRDNFAKNHKNELLLKSRSFENNKGCAIVELDEVLRKFISDEAQKIFPNVQQRSGYFSRHPKKED